MAVALWLLCFVFFVIVSRITGTAFRLIVLLVKPMLGGLLILFVVVLVWQTIYKIVLAVGALVVSILIYRSVRHWLDRRYHEHYLR